MLIGKYFRVALLSLVMLFMLFSDSLQKGKEKLLLVVEFSRHGIRSSDKIYPFTKNHPHDNMEGNR